jgi:hypothetical protein
VGADLLTYVPAKGDQFLIMLHWQSLRDQLDPATELRWSVEANFECSGQCSFEWRTPLVPNTRASLRSRDVIAARYSARLPLDLPDGSYRLRLAIDRESFDMTVVDIVHHDRAFDLPAGADPVGTIGGFDVFLAGPVAAQVHPGESILVKLAMRAGQETIVNYNVFVHLVDPSGRVAAQMDAWPQGGLWPTANWVRGQVVDDVYTLNLPPDAVPGDYWIAIGMYDPLDGSRLPVRDATGHVKLDGRLILASPVRVIAP